MLKGQNVIGDEIIINKDSFSSEGFEHYTVYQYELETPLYRVYKMDMPSLSMNDEVKVLSISDSSTGLAIPVSFLDVNNNRFILILEAAQFELKRVTE
ncbi:hypothetical protein BSK48_24790 [Paenibacillus odorifer]|nr:hypothetical protein BSK48_24790 [Paenibacillus odorifer]